MLSRSAERVYWLGRYLERAENTARIVQQYSQLLLDLPPEVGVKWHELLTIFGVDEARLGDSDVASIMHYMLADPTSNNSLAFCIRNARDNIRNARDLLPQESWESANELDQYARKYLGPAATGENTFEVLSDCISHCQQINGVLIGTMSHDSPYHFLRIGQNIERADMTSRIIDVAAAYLQKNERLVLRYGSTLWTNVLKSVSGFQMYRQYCQPEVEGLSVIDFLLNDSKFPRAIRYCLQRAHRRASALPRNQSLLSAIDTTIERLPSPLPEELDGASVTELMDLLQREFATLHSVIVDTWFLPA
ncbi:MAG TPA: alpha-E domain-containing protein [Woeseiaceae bacterium]|nr:alpha-E domain-containing protein [Woeseiaceae bacterium]